MSIIQLERIIPLPKPDLQQILDYGLTLSKADAAAHFTGILGESPATLEFISSFNARRKEPTPSSTAQSASTHAAPAQDPLSPIQGVPRSVRAPKKKKAPLHTLVARSVTATEYSHQGRAYRKDDGEEYIPRRGAAGGAGSGSNYAGSNSATGAAFSLTTQPAATKSSVAIGQGGSGTGTRSATPAAGGLISDRLEPVPKSSRASSGVNSRDISRNAGPAPGGKTKVTLVGGTAMHGASTALSELDSAIRSLELATNPTKNDSESRACNCIATRHPILASAPNCLNCGKVICVKEGLGPCTFCGTPLLSSVQIQGMIRSLKDERGREKMALDASSHKRAVVSRTPAPFSNPRTMGPTPGEQSLSAAEIAAKAAQVHRDKLLGFQEQNAKRTTVHDEAADFETPDAGTNMWGSVEERARQLKRQQKVMREQEWNARPEWERKKEVVSLEIVGGKLMRRTQRVEREQPRDSDDETEAIPPPDGTLPESNGNRAAGAFSRNPLLGGLIKPTWNAGKGKDITEAEDERPRRKAWRRVQDEYDDESAEQLILNGGALASQDAEERRDGDEEHAQG